MKKTTSFMSVFFLSALAGVHAAADGIVPATGERSSILPFILVGVAVVLIAALALLTYLSKNKKQ